LKDFFFGQQKIVIELKIKKIETEVRFEANIRVSVLTHDFWYFANWSGLMIHNSTVIFV